MNRDINATHALAVDPRADARDRAGRAIWTSRSSRAGDTAAQHRRARTLVELPGDVHFPWVGPQDDDPRPGRAVRRRARRARRRSSTASLATVVFTDIVGSTETAAELGDRALEGAPRGAPSPGARAARAVPRRRGRHRRRRLPRDVRRPGTRRAMRALDRRRGRAARARGPRRRPHRARSRRSTARSAAWRS